MRLPSLAAVPHYILAIHRHNLDRSGIHLPFCLPTVIKDWHRLAHAYTNPLSIAYYPQTLFSW